MSQSEEKLLILKMLEEGKISSEEAAKLLEALDGGRKQTGGESASKQQKPPNFQDEINRMRDRVQDWKRDFQSGHKQKDFDRAMDEFSTKAEKLGKTVAATTFSFVDKVVDFVGSFVDTHSFNFFGSFPTVEKTFEAIAVDGMDLHIEAVNNYITVKKHTEDKIIIKSKIRSSQPNPETLFQFSDNGSLISLKLNKIANISVSHEILLPAKKFNKIFLDTSNGRIYVEDALAQEFESVSRNGHIELMGVHSDKITATTKNARIQVSYVIGKDIQINTNNSFIDVKHIKAENIKAVTQNGRILVENAQNLENTPEMNIELKTSNGGIKVNMDDTDNRGYKVNAKTTNGSINILIPDMSYQNVNKQGVGNSRVEAESTGYSTYTGRVNITAETNNGFIEIVK